MPKITNIPSCRFNSGVMCATSCTGEGCGWHPETASIRKSAIREERKNPWLMPLHTLSLAIKASVS